MKADLPSLDGALVEHLGRDRPGRDVNSLLLRLVQHGGKESHLELERENVHARRAALAAFGDDFLDEEAADGEIDRSDDDQAARALSMKEPILRQRLGAIRSEYQLSELLLLARQGLFLFRAREPPANVQVGLAFVAAEVEDLEGAKRLAGGLELALHLNEALARGVDGELSEIGGDPFAAELFGDGGGRAGADEEIGDQVAGVAAGFDDAFEEGFGFLSGIAERLLSL
jgi:hypothetical protein